MFQLFTELNNSQDITKDMITGALDGSMTVDNRLFTSVGRSSIANDFKSLPTNLVKTAAGIYNTATNPFITAYKVAIDKDIKLTEAIDQWKGNATAGANIIRMDRIIINNLSEGKDVNEIQKAAGNEKLSIYYNENEVDADGNKVAGKHDNDNHGNVHLNAANDTATNTEKFVNTYGHESAHPFTTNENIADNAGSYAGGIYSFLNAVSGQSVNTSGGATSQSWLGQQMSNTSSATALLNNTIRANAVRNQSNLTIYIEGTSLFGARTYEESKEHSLKMAKLAAETLGDTSGNISFVFWDGGNIKEDRTAAAYQLLDIINNYDFAEGEPLNIVAHSHGGNVVKQFTNIYDLPKLLTAFEQATGAGLINQTYLPSLVNYKTVDNALLNGTPHRDDYGFNLNVMTVGRLPMAVSDVNDTAIQGSLGGTDFWDWPVNPSQTMKSATNIEINQFPNGSRFPFDRQYNSHTGLNTPAGWINFIDPAVRNSINNKQ